MQTRNSILLLAVATAILTLFTYTEAGAFANGNGVCDGTETADFTCANFGGNIIELVGTSNATCTLTNFPSTACAIYWYRYTGAATNQVNVVIPKEVMTKFTSSAGDTATAGCSQLFTDGSGDPTTGFGINLLSFDVCRIAATLTTNLLTNIAPAIPPTATFYLAADPSGVDHKQPLSWQLRFSKNSVFGGELLGPETVQTPISETGATVTATNGATITYIIQGGQVIITSGNATVERADQSLVCNLNGNHSNPPLFPSDYTCLPVTFFSQDVDFRLGTNSTCVRYVYIGGNLTKFTYAC